MPYGTGPNERDSQCRCREWPRCFDHDHFKFMGSWCNSHAHRTGFHDPMPVTFKESDDGTLDPDPAFSSSWDDLTKLRWKAGCAEAWSGVRPRIATNFSWHTDTLGEARLQSDAYGVVVGDTATSSYSFREMWVFLTGLEVGALETFRRLAHAASSE